MSENKSKTFDEVFAEIKAEPLPNWEHISAVLKHSSAPVVLYGAGKNCGYAIDNCNARDIQVACICDAYKTGCFDHKDVFFHIISPTELVKSYSNAFILITSYLSRKQIEAELIKLCFSKEKIFSIGIPTTTHDIFSEKYLEGYKWAYSFFDDELSRKHVIDNAKKYLCAKLIPADSSFAESYWAHPAIQFSKDEIFVDGGAYTGDTVKSFINHIKEYSRIYSFEPDTNSYNQALLDCEKYANVEFINKGLWSKDTTLQFYSMQHFLQGSYIINEANENGIKISDKNIIKIPVTSLDVFFADKADNELPTTIKMDIEGAEKEALIGAAGIIKKMKPKLIICAYHKIEDVYELPRTILNIRNDYKLSLWQIGESIWDLILYAY